MPIFKNNFRVLHNGDVLRFIIEGTNKKVSLGIQFIINANDEVGVRFLWDMRTQLPEGAMLYDSSWHQIVYGSKHIIPKNSGPCYLVIGNDSFELFSVSLVDIGNPDNLNDTPGGVLCFQQDALLGLLTPMHRVLATFV